MADQVAASEYARVVALEHENQALRDQMRDLQHLLQIKDTEIAVKYHLLQAKEQENAQARARKQLLEDAIGQTAEAEAARKASTYGRESMLLFSRASHSEKPCELAHLACVEKEALPLRELGEHLAACDLPELETPKMLRTPSGKREAAEAGAASLLSPSSSAAYTPSASSKSRVVARASGRERKKGERADEEEAAPSGLLGSPTAGANAEGAAGGTTESSRSMDSKSPQTEERRSSRGVSQAAEVLESALPEEKSHPSGPDAAGDEGAAPNGVRPQPVPQEPMEGAATREVTTSKRMAIVDPVSGEELELPAPSPAKGASRLKPTLTTLESLTLTGPLESRGAASSAVTLGGPTSLQGAPLGPSTIPTVSGHFPGGTLEAALPLTLPPVVAGSPTTLRSALPAPSPMPHYGGAWPPQALPSPSAQPPCPPPAHPAPCLGDVSGLSAAPVPRSGLPGGPVQLAKGALAAPSDASASGSAKNHGPGIMTPPATLGLLGYAGYASPSRPLLSACPQPIGVSGYSGVEASSSEPPQLSLTPPQIATVTSSIGDVSWKKPSPDWPHSI